MNLLSQTNNYMHNTSFHTKFHCNCKCLSVCVAAHARDETSLTLSRLLEVLEDGDAVDELLGDEAHGGEHGDAAVLQFLGLHLSERLRCVWLEAERVEFDVTRVIVVVQEVRAFTLGRRHPAELSTGGLDHANENGKQLEEFRLDFAHLAERVDGRSVDLTTEERVEALTKSDADTITIAEIVQDKCACSQQHPYCQNV